MTRLFFALLFCIGFIYPAYADDHAFSLHGTPKYTKDFGHFDYTNPQAPKGGQVVLAGIGTYDSLNPYILKGTSANGIAMIFDTLMVSSSDEASTEYGLLAESIAVADDGASVTFTLRPQARFHDGSPVTAEDVVFSFNAFKKDGHPFYRAYYGEVTQAQALDTRTVMFSFATGENRELPLILGQMPVISKAYYQIHDFTKTTLEPPLGSGPYRVTNVDPGRSITYERFDDYWGKDLSVNKGRFNFETIRYDYYRDRLIAMEAFKAGNIDFFQETVAKNWATAYDIPAVRNGQIIREEIRHEIPTGMQAFAFNTRRDLFKDWRVRKALSYAFDFEWSNINLFHGAYTRTKSYFSNSELASSALPEGDERELLNQFRDQLPARIFEQEYTVPETDGSGNARENLKAARDLLQKAGWQLQNGQLVSDAGTPFSFEILLVNPAFERIALPFVKNLEKLGIEANVRVVDAAQYQKRLETFDYDMTVVVIGQSLSPGNEQRDFWHSEKADIQGSKNYMGIKDPVVDALVARVINAPDRNALITTTRALDRVLLQSYYVIPQWHIRTFRVAYWNKFGKPEVQAKYALGFLTDWWVDPAKAAALDKSPAPSAQNKTEKEEEASFSYRWLFWLALALAVILWARKKASKK